MDESLADTIEIEEIKGTYPYLIEEDEIGLLYLNLDELDKSLGDRLKIGYDMLLALPEYERTGDKEILKEANEKTFNKAKGLRNEIIHIGHQDKSEYYPQLTQLKEKVDREYEKSGIEEKINGALSELI